MNNSDYTLIDNAFNTQPGTATSSSLFYQLNNALDVAQEQSQKTVAAIGTTGMYPQYVNADGSISFVPNTHWTVGTWPGLLWNLYQATGNVYYKNQAIAFTNPLSVDDTQTSDVGFRIYDSFYPLLQQEPGNTAVINLLLAAAAVAASGLLKLSALIKTSDPANSLKYRTAAGAILASLASTTYLANPATTDNGVLLQGALNVPANPSIPNNPIDFGDYYFVEAINEYLAG